MHLQHGAGGLHALRHALELLTGILASRRSALQRAAALQRGRLALLPVQWWEAGGYGVRHGILFCEGAAAAPRAAAWGAPAQGYPGADGAPPSLPLPPGTPQPSQHRLAALQRPASA